jgi:hypothetical protein
MTKGVRSKMHQEEIRDKTSEKQGYSRFCRSSVASDGRDVVFQYPSGVRYRVPLDYLLLWYDQPHRVRARSSRQGEVLVVSSRRVSGDHLVRIYLSDGREYDVAWDVVLMSCEPLYEHYGGFTERSKNLANEWKERHGSFRV